MGEMFGERLRLRRKARGLSQVDLSEMVGCTGQTISVYEQMGSKPKTVIAQRLEKVLGEF